MASAGGELSPSYRQIRFVAPSGSTEIYLVRHGESVAANPLQPFALVDGRGDPELSDEGHAQAAALAKRLATVEFAAIYVTNLRRTQQTAVPLVALTGLLPIVEPDLAEVHMGEWEGGLYRHKIATGDPLVKELFIKQRWDVIPGGESNEALLARTTGAITRIAARHPNARVLVIAHAVSISAVLAYATQASLFAFITSDNASLSKIIVGSETWSIRSFNDRAHLD